MPYQSLTPVPKERFRDVDMDLSLNPVTGDVATLSTEDSVKQSLQNIVLTNFYERPMQTFLGSQVTGMLFENYSTAHEYWIRSHIYRVCSRYEPRAEILEVTAGIDEENQSVRVKIVFTVIGSEMRSEVDVFFSRVR